MSLTRRVPQGSVLSPLLFNIFINDIFYFVRHARLIYIYADDQQIYDSDKDPMTLHLRMENELTTIVNWYAINSLKANPEKFQAMILGKKTYDFHFKIGNVEIDKETSINLLGVNLDNKLTFSKHISNICARVHNQIQVIKRFRHILSSSTKARLYKAFIMPHFQYCSTIWHFCGARNSEKLELLNKHALRIILSDNVSTYEVLLEKLDLVGLSKRRFLDMLILVHKSFISRFTPRTNSNGLRGTNKLQLPSVNTTSFGKNSFKFLAPKLWNTLNDDLRTTTNITCFRNNCLAFVTS